MFAKKQNIPNFITGLRLIFVPVLVFLILSQAFAWALWLTLAMAVSDAADGFLAKRLNWTTRFGTFFDPLADRLMLLSSLIALSVLGLLPWWLTATVLACTALLIAGGIVLYLQVSQFWVRPPLISKFNTLVQLTLIVWVLFTHAGFATAAGSMDWLIWLAALAAVASVLVYLHTCKAHIKALLFSRQ